MNDSGTLLTLKLKAMNYDDFSRMKCTPMKKGLKFSQNIQNLNN